MPLRGLSRLLGLSTSAALELVGLAGRTEELRLGLTGVLLAVLSSRSNLLLVAIALPNWPQNLNFPQSSKVGAKTRPLTIFV